MNKFSRTARSVTFAAIVGLSMGISAPAAIAAPETAIVAQADATGATTANIDFNKTGSLTINKRDLADGTAIDGTGAEQNAPGKPLAGVTFKVEKVNIDLSQAANWAELGKLTAADALKKGLDTSFAAQEQTTGADGQVKFDNLPVGIYVVTETGAPQGVIKGAPFVISLPFTNPTGTEWNYNPVVYPKNTKAEASKEVVDADKQIGEEITYTLKTPTPALGEGQTVKKYVITDDYDQTKVKPNLEKIQLKIASQVIPTEAYSVADNGDKITITFNDFAMLNANPSSVVVTTIPAKVTAQGEIVNSADVTFNNPNSDSDTVTIPTNEVFSYYGQVDVVKKDADEKDKVLEGAKFEVYASNDAVCGNDDDVQIFTDNQFVTDAQGKVIIKGLHATNIEDNNKLIDKTYCLKEVEAPAGYATPTGGAEWNSFKITATPKKEGEKVVAGGTIENTALTIENKKQSTPNLPMTGGAGVGILAAIGAAIVAAGAWFARRGSKAK